MRHKEEMHTKFGQEIPLKEILDLQVEG